MISKRAHVNSHGARFDFGRRLASLAPASAPRGGILWEWSKSGEADAQSIAVLGMISERAQ